MTGLLARRDTRKNRSCSAIGRDSPACACASPPSACRWRCARGVSCLLLLDLCRLRIRAGAAADTACCVGACRLARFDTAVVRVRLATDSLAARRACGIVTTRRLLEASRRGLTSQRMCDRDRNADLWKLRPNFQKSRAARARRRRPGREPQRPGSTSTRRYRLNEVRPGAAVYLQQPLLPPPNVGVQLRPEP